MPTEVSSSNLASPSISSASGHSRTETALTIPFSSDLASSSSHTPSNQGYSISDPAGNFAAKCSSFVLAIPGEEIREEIKIRLRYLFEADLRLHFDESPSPDKSFILLDPETILQVNSGSFTLTVANPGNRRFLETEARFCTLLRELRSNPRHQDSGGKNDHDVLEDLLQEALESLQRRKRRNWEQQASPSSSQYIFNNGKPKIPWSLAIEY
ncbi:hypothetical protein C8R42DRAFT_724476 [Lentinula raphanica]|nr:hypothetical protein C8R42DRAFT_724476 [Lentinula raphanica]